MIISIALIIEVILSLAFLLTTIDTGMEEMFNTGNIPPGKKYAYIFIIIIWVLFTGYLLVSTGALDNIKIVWL